jgi:hypothetical protein
LPRKYEAPLLVKLKPSARLKRLTWIMHGLALMACLANTLPIIIKAALFTVIFLQLWYVMKRPRPELLAIGHTETRGWEISSGGSHIEAVRILPSTVITIAVIFLHYEVQNSVVDYIPRNPGIFKGRRILKGSSKKNLLVLSDALSEDDYRRLIVKLKTSTIK